MKASEKYKTVFGSIEHLSNEIPWTTGLSNMVEFLVWNTSSISGVSKKDYSRIIVDWALSNEMNDLSKDEVVSIIDKKLKELGDVLWYLAMSAQRQGFTLSQVATANVQKLAKRYPSGFSPEASIARADGEKMT